MKADGLQIPIIQRIGDKMTKTYLALLIGSLLLAGCAAQAKQTDASKGLVLDLCTDTYVPNATTDKRGVC